jgi:hypothetical protein
MEDLLYRRVLDLSWMCDGVPSEPEKLAPLTRFSDEDFKRFWPSVSRKFHEKDGLLRNKRLEHERTKANMSHQKRVHAGSKAQAMLKQCSSNAGSNSTHRPLNVNVTVPLSVEEKREGSREERGETVLDQFQATLFDSVLTGYPVQEDIEGAKRAWSMIHPKPDQVFAAMLVKKIAEQKRSGCLDSSREHKPHLKSWIQNKRWTDRNAQAEESERVNRGWAELTARADAAMAEMRRPKRRPEVAK